jgi:hypothetical protein
MCMEDEQNIFNLLNEVIILSALWIKQWIYHF